MEKPADWIVELEPSGIEYTLEEAAWFVELTEGPEIILEWLDYPMYRE
jgi:hypothetical protein